MERLLTGRPIRTDGKLTRTISGTRPAAAGPLNAREPPGPLRLRPRPLHLVVRRCPVRGRNLVALQECCSRRADSFLHSGVGRSERPAAGGEHATRLQQRGHAGPPALRVRPMQRRCRMDQPVPFARPQVLERSVRRPDAGGHVLAQLGEHGLVGIGRGHHDPSSGERAGRLARPSADPKGSPDRMACVCHHHVEQCLGILRPKPFVGFHNHSEAQRAPDMPRIPTRAALSVVVPIAARPRADV